MKKVIYSIVASGLILACSCQTIPVPIAFTAEPDDAKIYVDGNYLGMGTGTSCDRRKPGNFPVSIFESMQVNIVHPDYKPFSTVIRPKPDWANQLLCTAPFLLLGGLMVSSGPVLVYKNTAPFLPIKEQYISYQGAGVLALICGSLFFVLFWKFDRTYSFKLVEKAPAKMDSDSSR
jgi:hypothetical protein